jgi:hypothetical protein
MKNISAHSTGVLVPHVCVVLQCTIAFLRFSNRNELAILALAERRVTLRVSPHPRSSLAKRRDRVNLPSEHLSRPCSNFDFVVI